MPEVMSLDAMNAGLGPPPTQSGITPPVPLGSTAAVGQGTGGMDALAPRPAPAPQGETSFDAIANGVRWVESNNKHYSAPGKVLQGPMTSYGERAVGIMQLMPSSHPGENIYDEGENIRLGEKELRDDYEKYGNWPDALAAYNWGPAKVDRWIAGGRDPSKMPAETRRYIPAVLSAAGLDSGAGSVGGRRIMSAEDMQIGPNTQSATPAGLAEAMGQGLTSVDEMGIGSSMEFVKQGEALLQGARDGIMDLVTGPGQVAAEAIDAQTGGTAANTYTQTINKIKSDYMGGTSASEEHPAFNFTGQILGLSALMYASKGMLGPIAAPAAIARVLPAGLRAAALGGFLGGTAYKPDVENDGVWSRLFETALGSTLGAAGVEIGKGAAWAARKIADRNTYSAVLQSLNDTVGEMSRNATKPLNRFINHVEGLWAQNNKLYGARRMGSDGFEPSRFREVLKAPMEETRQAGVAVAPSTKTWASRVYEELGFRDADAAKASAEAAQDTFAKEMAKWQKTYTTGLNQLPEQFRQPILQRDIANGKIPAPPTAPLAHVPAEITPAQYSAAMTVVNRGLRSTKRDAAAQHQLTALRQGLTNEAGAQAAAAGTDLTSFLRDAEKANKFYQEKIVPVKDIFGTATPSQLRDPNRLTPAKFFDKVGQAVKDGDLVTLKRLKGAVGTKGLEDLKRISLWNVLHKGQPADGKFVASKAVEYVRQNHEALETLLGRDKVVELTGWANVAETVAAKPTQHTKFFGGLKSSVLPYIGLERVAEGIMHGTPVRGVVEGGVLVAAPIFAHMMFSAISKADRVPGILPLVRKAGTLRSDSPALEALTQRIESLYARQGQLAARLQGVAQEGGQPDPLLQEFAPLRP